jgi:DNA-binding CsgD family transcriptional regulator
LKIWRDLNNPIKQGETLAHITFMLNGLGRTGEAEEVCRQAIDILEAEPPSLELAFAYRVQSGLHMLNHNSREAIEWGKKAIALAERFEDTKLILATGVTIGSAWLSLDYEYGRRYLEDIRDTALEAGLETVTAHAYANLSSVSSMDYHFAMADRYTSAGTAYAYEHGQERFRRYMLAWQAVTHMRRGRWQDAIELATWVIQRPGISVTTRITALSALGFVYARQGNPLVEKLLNEAIELSKQMGSLHRVGLVRAARAEAAWLNGDRAATLEEANAAFDLAVSKQHPWFTGELAYWRWRCGDQFELPDWIARPFALQIYGDWEGAAAEWERLGCPYEQARSLADGDSDAQLIALEVFEGLGARPEADRLREVLRRKGVGSFPRRPRISTQDNPFGLTNRQVEILALLTEHLTNAEIAARLHISAKTVDHHISAVLSRLEVDSRLEAAALARQHTELGSIK